MSTSRILLGCLSGIFGLYPLIDAAAAQARPTFGDCAKQIEKRGFEIYDMDAKSSMYEVDAIKSGSRWDVRVDINCQVIDERPD